MEKAIEEAMDYVARRYTNNEATKTVNIPDQTITYEMDLGGRLALIAYSANDDALLVGIKNGRLITTIAAKDYYKKVLKDFESDILAWRKDHVGCAKRLWELD